MAEKSTVRAIPEGYGTVTPWIVVRGAADMIDYLKEAFGAVELGRVNNPNGKIGHAEVRIGDSVVMLFDARDDWPETPSFNRLYVEDAEAVFQQAVKAGGTVVTEITTLGFGDRVGRVRDPKGNLWWIQQHIEDLTPEEMGKRATDPKYSEAMQRVQNSLDREMRGRKGNV
ncbi:MAG: VOC family protein [Chloroflexota bacterium]